MNKEYYSVRRIGDDEEAYLAHANGFKYLSKKWVNGAWRYIYDVTGLGARDRRDAANVNLRAQQQANRSRRQSGATYGVQTLRSARNKANAAQKAYDNTLAGRAEKAFKGASKAVSRTVGSAQKALSNLTGKANKAVNSYKAQQNSKKISKKVSKKNAEFKKQQLEKIQKSKEKAGGVTADLDKRAMERRALYNRTRSVTGDDHFLARDTKQSYYDAMEGAKNIRNWKRAEPKRQKADRDRRAEKLHNNQTATVNGKRGATYSYDGADGKKRDALAKVQAGKERSASVGGRIYGPTRSVKSTIKPKIQKREGNMSREYWEELIYNRKKNRYR